ncbi:MAG: hypothetical protein P8P83_04055 [Rickettsiaceae bacterium]|nr:hypothetical protein [Rickettsiaceae bacterium]
MDTIPEESEYKENTKKSKLPTPKKLSRDTGALEQLLRDKTPAEQKNFTQAGEKNVGVSGGYVATENASTNTHILKHAYKTEALIPNSLTPNQFGQHLNDRRDFVNELITSSIYRQLLLFDRAPLEQLVTTSKENDALYVRSKFFKNSKTLAAFTTQNDEYFDAHVASLQSIEGFEKTIAACHIMGEIDYHAANLMVEEHEGKNTLKKIDHGRSLLKYNKDFSSLIDNTFEKFNRRDYQTSLETNNLSFNIQKYSDSLTQMLKQITPDAIDSIIDQRIADLKKHGFDPRGIKIVNFSGARDILSGTIDESFENLSQQIKSSLKSNIESMKDVALKTGVIAQFDSNNRFKNGLWLKAFHLSRIKDPVLYASANHITIQGKEPIHYAIDHGIKIEGKDPVLYASTDNITIQGKDPIHYAIDNGIKIDKKDPLLYSITHQLKKLTKNERFSRQLGPNNIAELKELTKGIESSQQNDKKPNEVLEPIQRWVAKKKSDLNKPVWQKLGNLISAYAKALEASIKRLPKAEVKKRYNNARQIFAELTNKKGISKELTKVKKTWSKRAQETNNSALRR